MKKVDLFVGGIISGFVAGLVTGGLTLGRQRREAKKKMNEDLLKTREFYFILLQWIKVHQEHRSLVNFFIKNGYKNVAIYGMRELGEALLDELRGTQINVKFGIDRDADAIFSDIDVFKPDNCPDDVDVVVVTAVHYYDEIEQMLQSRFDCKIVSLEDVVWEA